MHSSRMRTARTLTIPGVSDRGVVCPQGRVPCDLSHQSFDVTCMLPPHQLRPTNSAVAYIVLDLKGMLGYHPPPREQNDRHL